MKKIFVALLCTISFSINAQTWTQLGALPANYQARNHPVTFSIGDFGYVATGAGTSYLGDFYRYDPNNDSWTPLANFPGGPRSFAYGVTNNGKGYVGFGLVAFSQTNFTYFNDLWEYNPSTDSWKKLADCPGSGRRHPAMVATPGKIFVGCGDGPTGNLKDWWEYDIATDSWSQKADLPSFERHHPYFFDIDGEAYVGFGHNGNFIYKDMYKYNPSSQAWSAIASLPAQGRVAGTQFSYGGKGYLLSGQGENHSNLPTGEFWEYDPISNTWASLTAHPGSGRWAPGSFLVNNTVYLTCGAGLGASQTDLKDMWKFDMPFAVSVNEVEKKKLNIYPVPAHDKLMISSDNKIDQLEVFTIYGAAVQIDMSNIDSKTATINTSNLSEGIYLLRQTYNKSYSTKQFIVKH